MSGSLQLQRPLGLAANLPAAASRRRRYSVRSFGSAITHSAKRAASARINASSSEASTPGDRLAPAPAWSASCQARAAAAPRRGCRRSAGAAPGQQAVGDQIDIVSDFRIELIGFWGDFHAEVAIRDRKRRSGRGGSSVERLGGCGGAQPLRAGFCLFRRDRIGRPAYGR